MATSNTLETVSPPTSLAITFKLRTPTSSLPGVPLNVAVSASNVSHAGRTPSSTSEAEYVKVDDSTSAKVPAGTAKLNGASSVAAWSAIGFATAGTSLTDSTSMLTVAVEKPPLPS